MSIEAMKQALEALEDLPPDPKDYIEEAVEILRQAIEQAEKQEPVAWVEKDGDLVWQNYEAAIGRNLYTIPQPQREWVGLTDKEIDQGLLRSDYALQTAHAWRAGVVFAMTQLKEKNT